MNETRYIPVHFMYRAEYTVLSSSFYVPGRIHGTFQFISCTGPNTRYFPVHFMYRAEYTLHSSSFHVPGRIHCTFHGSFHVQGRISACKGRQYSTNTDYVRQNGTVRQMNHPLLMKCMRAHALLYMESYEK